ncbi:putative bifunctional diguanylate cyclase/phosphodiesterase [Vibrio ostreicida]|uniref:putative bifunctional diguanylate cyclase/phosphodiesterase n=1 Tax=Vibrio ostreicida TaxID=526588 RepID=UPI00097072DF|nr:EAL domain-containing protein [Vibrio ostreicida]
MKDSHSQSDDVLTIIEDTDELNPTEPGQPKWTVLVVDDDEEVHHATNLALKDLIIEQRHLALIHAYSASQAEDLLRTEPCIHVALLDVVMESDDAGLTLVKTIRNTLHLDALRIILRTGQPGYAPEMETISRFDINDYRTKSELTRVKLFTILTSAIRAYQQIRNQHEMRQGLEKVVRASTELANTHGMRLFAEGAVKQISAIIQIDPEGLICVQENAEADVSSAHIIAAAGKYSRLVQTPLDRLNLPNIQDSLIRCLTEKRSSLEHGLTLYFATEQGRGLAAYVEVERPLESVDKHLLEVFCANLSVGFDNVLLYNRLEEQAFVDPVLKIPNLNSLFKLLSRRAHPSETRTLALIDIDDFSAINDSFGHAFGDSLLEAVSQRLAEGFPRHFLARVGSDVFALVGLTSELNADSLMAIFKSPLILEKQTFKVMASIGLVALNEGTGKLTRYYKDAQVALKQAKLHHRGGAVLFSERMGQSARDRIQLLNDLKEAVDSQQLFLMYQPKYNLADGRITGVEALLRWENKQGNMIPPDQFISLAERSGLILKIGDFVLAKACQEFSQLRDQGYQHLSMAINVSPIQLEESDFIALLKRTLAEFSIPATHIEIEITETMAAHNLTFMCQILEQVRQLGCKVAIDDFGTGFSSLNVLNKLPATRLKIDRSFVAGIEHSDSIVKMIVELGQNLGMEVTAEGIETLSQKEKLQEYHCEEGQGWWFAKAMTMSDLLIMLEQEHCSQ